MTSPRIEQAEALVAQLKQVLAAAGLPEVVCSLRVQDADSGARHGVVVVAPPELTFDAPYGDVQIEFEVYVIAGPATDYIAAWDRIDTIIQAFVDADVNLKDAKPTTYEPHQGHALNAYVLTLNEL